MSSIVLTNSSLLPKSMTEYRNSFLIDEGLLAIDWKRCLLKVKGTEQMRAGAETECVLVCVCERERGRKRESGSYKTDFGLQPAQSETAVLTF